MKLTDQQKKVVSEKVELDDRLRNLGVFINHTSEFRSLKEEERSRLIRQRACMEDLSGILGERIEAFKKENLCQAK